MSEPEVRLVMDEDGRIEYRATMNSLLVSEDEVERVRRYVDDLKALLRDMDRCRREPKCEACEQWLGYVDDYCRLDIDGRVAKLGIEVD